MNIEVAKSAGFCFGVNRAISIIEDLLKEGNKVQTLGPIIHNPQMVEKLRKNGVTIADDLENFDSQKILVLRSHGVTKQTIEELEQKGIRYKDATCPFVSKIHNIVKTAFENGDYIFIAGDKTHPEVEGIRSYCFERSFVYKNCEELENFINANPQIEGKCTTFVAQTTYNIKEWKKCLEIIKKVYTNAKIFDTICIATSKRQEEAIELAKRNDLIIVIGGKHSSNTNKLCEICSQYCKSILVEKSDDLPLNLISKVNSIGVTAGASTPADIIKEVLSTMSDLINQIPENEDFAAMLEESLKASNTSEKVVGVVVGIAPNEISVEVIGRKHTGFVLLEELTGDPTAKTEDIVSIGDRINLLIMKTNDQEGTLMLSKKRYDAIEGWEAVQKAAEDKTILSGVVTEVIKGGVIVITNGFKVFIPASQATANRGDNLEDLLKTTVSFRIIDAKIDRGRKRAVGSIRSVMNDKRKEQENLFWESAEEGKAYAGVVKSLTSYGAFVDIGGVDGMIHISELSWNRIKNPAEVLSVGDKVDVYILKLDTEKKKISLGYKKSEDNPWEILAKDYPVGTIADATIVSLTDFGAFARVIPGIDGLIHISQVSSQHIEKPADVVKVGDVVKVKITAVDFDKKRVSLSMKDAMPEAEETVEEVEAE